ncbi:MAG: Gfo/Idh/MocA family oxidoreductase [Leptospiraceae bacterium]|nr:Gfo/Idh/MocA family oxidoreductase [Leptospiraceae bacterium]MDW7976546.1 Gfo/Idh/MocA family oxidoreductase [Leptospiraceae bacterium]
MNNKIKLGIVGVGHMGQYHVNVAISIPKIEVVGVYDVDKARLKEISEKFYVKPYDNLDALIRDSDALIIAVPTKFHFELAKKCLESEKHILVEKPITETVREAEELIELAEKKGLILQVGHVERFNGAILEIKKIIENPYFIETKRLSPFNPRVNDIGVVLDLMIHDLDIILNLIPSEIRSIYARGIKAITKYEDLATATIQFESGTIANLVASRVTQNKIRTLTITQEKSYVVLNFATQDIDIYRMASSAYLMTREELKYKQESFVEKIFVHKDNPLKLEHLHFIHCILGQEEPLVPNHKDILTMKYAHQIIEDIYKHF